MSKGQYNALVGSKRATQVFGYNHPALPQNASNPNFIDPRRLVGNMPDGKRKRHRKTASIESGDPEISVL
jgi:hypothetical protein